MSKPYYSQGDEEPAILQVFERAGIKSGRFLDVGAYDGRAFSNTHRLAELGWSGVCIEPSPTVFPQLMKLYESNPNIELIQAAVGSEAKFMDFYDSNGDALSTTSLEHVQKWQRGYSVNYRKFLVYMLPFSAVFDRYGFQFDFINIDVENANLELFNLLPVEKLTATRAICVEHDGATDQMMQKVRGYGFQPVFTNGENLILAR